MPACHNVSAMEPQCLAGLVAGVAAGAYAMYTCAQGAPKASTTGFGGKVVTGYWSIRGLGAPMRMMSAFAGQEVEDKQYSDGDSWFKSDKPQLLKLNALTNLPYLHDVSAGVVVTQSTGVYQYLGRKLGLMGSTEAETAAVEQVLAQAFDLRNDLMGQVYPFGAVKTVAEYDKTLPEYMKGANGHFTKFAAWVSNRTENWAVH
jgi:hypothetical protein